MSDRVPGSAEPSPGPAEPQPGPVQPGAGHVGPGIASVRGDIRGVRFLLYGCTALVLVLLLAVGVAVISLRAQVDDLRAQVASAVQPAGAPPAASGLPAPAPAPAPTPTQAPASPQAAGVVQLGAAADLQGVELPAGADSTGAIVIGDPTARTVVETYIDYQCPFCQQWEAMHGTALMARALEPGSGIQVKQYNLAFLGETSADLAPAGASARAASAAACVIDHDGPEAFAEFSRAVFESADPSEPPGQFTAQALSALASKAGASADTLACITDETFVPFVSATTKSGFARGVTGTPTVIVDGVTVGNPFTDAAVTALSPQAP